MHETNDTDKIITFTIQQKIKSNYTFKAYLHASQKL